MFTNALSQEIQSVQLSMDNVLGGFSFALENRDAWANKPFLAELNPPEGVQIPLVIRMGPNNDPDPGSRKKYRALEIDGDGQGILMVWVDRRLVAKGFLSAQQAPRMPRKLNIPRGLGTGYGLDFMLIWQGTLLGVEIFWESLPGAGVPE